MYICKEYGNHCSGLEEELKEHGLDQEIAVVKTGCFGLCAMGRSWWCTRNRSSTVW